MPRIGKLRLEKKLRHTKRHLESLRRRFEKEIARFDNTKVHPDYEEEYAEKRARVAGLVISVNKLIEWIDEACKPRTTVRHRVGPAIKVEGGKAAVVKDVRLV